MSLLTRHGGTDQPGGAGLPSLVKVCKGASDPGHHNQCGNDQADATRDPVPHVPLPNTHNPQHGGNADDKGSHEDGEIHAAVPIHRTMGEGTSA